MGCFCESGFSKSIPTGAAGTSARSRAQSTTADRPGLHPALPTFPGRHPRESQKETESRRQRDRSKVRHSPHADGPGSNPGPGSSRRRGTGGSRQGRPSSPPAPARGPHPAPRPGGETTAALPGAAAAEVAPLGLASVLRPRRLRSGQGWSGRRSPPARALRLAPTSSSPPPARCSWLPLAPSLPSLSKSFSPSLPSLSPTAHAHTHMLPSLAFLPPPHSPTLCLLLSPGPSFLLSLPHTFPFVFLFFFWSRSPLFPSLSPSLPPTPPTAWPGTQTPAVPSLARRKGTPDCGSALVSAHSWTACPGRARPMGSGAPATLGWPALSHLESS